MFFNASMTFGAEPSLLALYNFLWSCAKKGGRKNARQRSQTRGGKAKEEGKRGVLGKNGGKEYIRRTFFLEEESTTVFT